MGAIDFYDDLGETYLLAVGEPPDFLKEAQWREPCEMKDRDFALILVDGGGREHRKFANFDLGNTLMSAFYLINAPHQLPVEAVKVAAVNLQSALADFGALSAALPMLSKLAALEAPPARILDERRVMLTKTATPLRLPGLGAPTSITKVASPFDLVKEAGHRWDDLDMYDRHEVAVLLIKEASESGITVPDHIFQYGGETLNPQFRALMKGRQQFVRSEELRNDYDRLGKVAGVLSPEEAVEALCMLDDQASLTTRYGRAIPNPVLCVYGQTKEAEWSWMHGSEYVDETRLKAFGRDPISKGLLDSLFTEALCDAFREDPVRTFKKLPTEQKVIISRLANQAGKQPNRR